MSGLPHLNWRKSSYSNGNNGACVEVAAAPEGGRYLRDTKDRTKPAHYFTAAEWDAFIKGAKAGEFD
jgi:predicted secreted Zn-dependent protease